MYSEEDGILYHRIQEDEEIEELENYLEYSHIKCNSRGTDFQSFTILIMCNPTKNKNLKVQQTECELTEQDQKIKILKESQFGISEVQKTLS